MSGNWQPQLDAQEINGGPIEGGPDGVKGSEKESHGEQSRKSIVVVGLGMVGISFMCVLTWQQQRWSLFASQYISKLRSDIALPTNISLGYLRSMSRFVRDVDVRNLDGLYTLNFDSEYKVRSE